MKNSILVLLCVLLACSPEVKNMDDVLARVDNSKPNLPTPIPIDPTCSFKRIDSIYIRVDTNLLIQPIPKSYFNAYSIITSSDVYRIYTTSNNDRIDLKFYYTSSSSTGIFPPTGVYTINSFSSPVSTGGVLLSGRFGGTSSPTAMNGVSDGKIYVKETTDPNVREVVFCDVKMRWNYYWDYTCGLTMNGSALIKRY